MGETHEMTNVHGDVRAEIEDFFYQEADLLDERRYDEWLELLADDLTYEVPVRRNVAFDRLAAHENTVAGRDVMWFDEDKATLAKRVLQLNTGEHWAEEPVSRVSHLVTNIRLVSVQLPLVSTTSRVLICRNRVDTETDIIVGRRRDTLIRRDGGWRLQHRQVLLEQSVLQAKNLTFFL